MEAHIESAVMNSEARSATHLGRRAHPSCIYLKVSVVLLLLAIAGFSALAKNSQYSAQSNPAHFITFASKMIVSPLPAVIDQTPLRPVGRFLLPQPESRITQETKEEVPTVRSISVTVSLQHRSPPISLS
jgi:hypothetical protein